MSRPPAPPGLPTVTSAWPARAALALLLASLAAFLAWQYGMPRAFESRFLLNHAGVEHFRAALGLPRWQPALGPYRAGFRALLGLSWVTYFALLMAGGLGGPLPRRRALSVILVGTALAAAFLWPPSFSCDIYAYVGYARMKVVHGVNPYVTSQQWLIDHHDATGPFLRWNIASPYGPLWTTVSAALVWSLRGASLYAQVVAFKLLGAGALLASAWGGGRVAERLSVPQGLRDGQPTLPPPPPSAAPVVGRGELTRVAIGLNPLFVMEAAGNGHNDFVMMALVVWAFVAALERRTMLAVLLAGAAGAIKFLPFLLVPWFVLADWRSRGLPWRRRARESLGLALAAVAPMALSLWPWWMGASTMRGLRQHWGSQVSGDSGVYAWVQAALFLAIFGAATVWALRGEDRAGDGHLPRAMGAWVVVTSLVFMITTGVWLPWYLSWIWIVALLDWNRRSLTFSYLAFCFAVVLTIRYSVPA